MVKEIIQSEINHASLWLKVLAFVFPLFVMYGPVNDELDNAANQQLWGYILAGLITEVAILMAVAFLL